MSTTVLCCNVIGICYKYTCILYLYKVQYFYIFLYNKWSNLQQYFYFVLYLQTVYLFFIYCTVDCVIGLVCRSVCTVAYSNNLYTVQHCNYLINPFVLITSTLFLLYCVLVLCYLLNLPFYKRKLSK